MSQNKIDMNKIDIIDEGKILKYLSSTGERKIIKTHKREFSIYMPYDEKSEFENSESGCKRKRV
jgi:hypothetical protein